MYYVYVHTVPNGKIYIGRTKEPVRRWNNGEGYKENQTFYNDILNYGWKNIKHEIIAACEDKEYAMKLESVLIALMKSEHKEYGYNQTSIYNDAMKKYIERTEIHGATLEKTGSEESIFEYSNLPISVCEEMINQWIFNEEHRNILKSRLIDGVSYPKLSDMYQKSVRQLKNIVYTGCDKLEKHL